MRQPPFPTHLMERVAPLTRAAPHRVPLFTMLGTALLLAACNAAPDRQSRGADAAFEQAMVAPEAAPAARSVALPAPKLAAGKNAAASDAPEQFTAPQPALPGAAPGGQDQSAPMLIRTGDASVEVANVDSAVASVQALATRLGGYVTSSSRQSGDYEVRSATIQLRVPAPRFDEAMGGLRPLGKVEYVNVAAEDVGEEYTDIQARMENQRRLESRLVELLATRTGKLEDVLAVERELARVRETIERYEGRLRYLGSRVALSTLTVTVHEKAPLAGINPGRNPIVAAFGQAWRNLVAFVAGFIAALGVLAPLAVLAWIGWWLLRRALPGRLSRRRTPPATGSSDR